MPLLVHGTGLGTQTVLTIIQPVTAIKHDLANTLKYILEWAAAVCAAVPHLAVQFVLSLDHFSVPSVLPRRDRFDQFNTALY